MISMKKWIISLTATLSIMTFATASAAKLVAYDLHNATVSASTHSAPTSYTATGLAASDISFSGYQSTGVQQSSGVNYFDSNFVDPTDFYSFSVTFPRGGKISSLSFNTGVNDHVSLPLTVEWSTDPTFATVNTLGSVTAIAAGGAGVWPPTTNLVADTSPFKFSAGTYYFRVRPTGSPQYGPSQWTITNFALNGSLDPISIPTLSTFGLILLALMLGIVAARAKSSNGIA